jgi:hypothetical protein
MAMVIDEPESPPGRVLTYLTTVVKVRDQALTMFTMLLPEALIIAPGEPVTILHRLEWAAMSGGGRSSDGLVEEEYDWDAMADWDE